MAQPKQDVANFFNFPGKLKGSFGRGLSALPHSSFRVQNVYDDSMSPEFRAIFHLIAYVSEHFKGNYPRLSSKLIMHFPNCQTAFENTSSRMFFISYIKEVKLLTKDFETGKMFFEAFSALFIFYKKTEFPLQFELISL